MTSVSKGGGRAVEEGGHRSREPWALCPLALRRLGPPGEWLQTSAPGSLARGSRSERSVGELRTVGGDSLTSGRAVCPPPFLFQTLALGITSKRCSLSERLLPQATPGGVLVRGDRGDRRADAGPQALPAPAPPHSLSSRARNLLRRHCCSVLDARLPCSDCTLPWFLSTVCLGVELLSAQRTRTLS